MCFETISHVVEPEYPGVIESYVNLGDCYDRTGLLPLRQTIMDAAAEYKSHYPRAYRCLDAASKLRRDNLESLLTDSTAQRLRRRAAGIISREIKKTSGIPGRVTHRFLSAVTHKGRIFLRDTVTAQAARIYELSDSFGLAHELLLPILAAGTAAGWDVVACPAPMTPDRLSHLIFPGLSLAFVSAPPDDPWPQRPYRRLRLDAMTDKELSRRQRPRLRFSRKVAAALEQEAVSALGDAKAAHDRLEALYNPHVDFDRVYGMADAIAAELLGGELS